MQQQNIQYLKDKKIEIKLKLKKILDNSNIEKNAIVYKGKKSLVDLALQLMIFRGIEI